MHEEELLEAVAVVEVEAAAAVHSLTHGVLHSNTLRRRRLLLLHRRRRRRPLPLYSSFEGEGKFCWVHSTILYYNKLANRTACRALPYLTVAVVVVVEVAVVVSWTYRQSIFSC